MHDLLTPTQAARVSRVRGWRACAPVRVSGRPASSCRRTRRQRPWARRAKKETDAHTHTRMRSQGGDARVRMQPLTRCGCALRRRRWRACRRTTATSC
jgi:hypothetical protein